MATLLAAVNDTLKQVKIIQGSSGELTTFTKSSLQSEIDIMLNSWNDVIDELYKGGHFNGEQATANLTLVTDTREYSVPSDFISVIGPMLDETNGRFLYPYPVVNQADGYHQMRVAQPVPANFTGLPGYWAINPVNNKFRLDKIPTSAENALVYAYVYEKRINLTATTDTFPFNDDVVDALRDAVSETWKKKRQAQFDEDLFNASMSRAAMFLRPIEAETSYGLQNANA